MLSQNIWVLTLVSQGNPYHKSVWANGVSCTCPEMDWATYPRCAFAVCHDFSPAPWFWLEIHTDVDTKLSRICKTLIWWSRMFGKELLLWKSPWCNTVDDDRDHPYFQWGVTNPSPAWTSGDNQPRPSCTDVGGQVNHLQQHSSAGLDTASRSLSASSTMSKAPITKTHTDYIPITPTQIPQM